MSIKFSIPTVAIVVLLTLSHSAIANAEIYKTSKNQVIVTELKAKQKYPVKVVNAKNKARTLKDKIANGCGEIIVDNADKYKSLIVGTETIDPATLITKERARCNPKKNTVAKATKKKATVTVIPGTMTIPSSTVPTNIRTMAPTVK